MDLTSNPCTLWSVELPKLKLQSLNVLSDLRLATLCSRFIVGLKECSLIACPKRKLLPINCSRSLLWGVFGPRCLLMLSLARLLIMNISLMKPQRLILQLRFRRSRDSTIALEILGLQLMWVKFSKVLGHIKPLFFWHKDLHLLEPF